MDPRTHAYSHDHLEAGRNVGDYAEYFSINAGFVRAHSDHAQLPDRTPTPESEQEPMSPECGMIADGSFNVSGCGMPWMPVHPGCNVQQPQPGQAVAKAFPPHVSQMSEGCGYAVPVHHQQPMDMWQSVYQQPPPPYQQQQPPPAAALGGAGEQPGLLPVPGLTAEQLQALEQDPELAAVFQDIKRNGPVAALRAFQDEELMMKISKKIQTTNSEAKQPGKPSAFQQGDMPQSDDAKAGGCAPMHCGSTGAPPPMPKWQGAPAVWDGYGRPPPGGYQAAAAPPRGPGPPGQPLGGCAPPPPHQHQPQPPPAKPPGAHQQSGAPCRPGMEAMPPMPLQQQASHQGLNAIDATHVINGVQRMDGHLVSQVVMNTICRLPWSVCLSDPNMEDCPIVGCSEGFEVLTGYSKKDILGKNCRFLNQGIDLKEEVRSMLHEAAASRGEFVGSLPNIRKNGELFENLLHMTTLTIRGKRYIIAIQADVTNLNIDMNDPGHLEELQAVAARIFSNNIDAWVQMQVREFAIRQPVPYSKVLMRSDPSKFIEAMGNFVHIACDTSRVQGKDRQERHRDQDRNAGHPPGSVANVANICMDDATTTSDTEQAADARQTSQPPAEPDGRQPPDRGHAPEGGSQQEEQPLGESALKSLGSAGHPDHCQAECVFHFFRGGCKGGVNCRFCHDFHPRKNPKKNRRALRRFIANAGFAEEAVGGSSVDELSVCNNPDELPPARSDLPQRQVSDTPSVPTVDGAERREFAPDVEREGLVKISYGQGQAVTLLTGVRLRLEPRVDVSTDCQASERTSLQFSVEPPLPAGLSLSSADGVISGIPTECVSNQAYTVTVGTEAIGLGSMKLGLVPIASAELALTVVELHSYTATYGTEDEAGRLKIVFQKGT